MTQRQHRTPRGGRHYCRKYRKEMTTTMLLGAFFSALLAGGLWLLYLHQK